MGVDETNKQIIVYESNGVRDWQTNAVHYGADQHEIKTVTILRDKAYNKAISGTTEKTIMVTVACPVDVEVYNNGNIVGRVTDNTIDEDVTDIDAFVYNEEKNFLLPYENNYQIKLYATDEGSMKYTVEEMGEDDYHIKEFINVSLVSGQRMTNKVNTVVSENKLYITDDNGNITKEIYEDGTENPIETGSISDNNANIIPTTDPYIYETLTAGDNTYTIKWPKTVKFDGRKHNGVGMTADNSPYNPKESSSKICDVEVTISMNGEIIDPSSYTVKTKNNKKANLSPDGTETIQQKTPSFKIKAKGEALSGLKDQLKSKNFEFGILPIELNKEKMSFENQKTAKDGSTVFGKVLFNGPEKEGHSSAKTLKLKYKPDESKTDYVTTVSENGDLLLTGKNNYYGTVTCK